MNVPAALVSLYEVPNLSSEYGYMNDVNTIVNPNFTITQ